MPRTRGHSQAWETDPTTNGVALSRPLNTVAGDMLYVVLGSDNNRIFSAPTGSGWTKVDQAVAGNFWRLELWSKPAAAGDPASWRFTCGVGAYVRLGMITAVMEAADQVNAISKMTSTEKQRAYTIGQITTNVDSALLMAAYLTAEGGTLTPPPGMTERTEIGVGYFTIALNDQQQVLLGETGERTANSPIDSYYSAGIMWAVGPSPLPPNAPQLLEPSNGDTINLAATPRFSWRFGDPNTGDTQNGWALRRKVGTGSYQYWNASTNTWSATIVWNAGSAQTYQFPAGAWANGTTYNWSVANRDQTNRTGPFAADLTISGGTAPTVVVTGPGSPVTDTNRPTVTWTFADSEGHTQQTYRVRVIRASVYTQPDFAPGSARAEWDSGVVTSAAARSVMVGELDNTTTYRAYVQSVDSSGMSSTWSYAEFTVNVAAPSPPTVSAVAQHTEGYTQITVQGTHSQVTYPQATFRVEYSTNGGVTWQVVRGAENLPPSAGNNATINDHEATPYRFRRYRARTMAVGATSRISSAPSNEVNIRIEPTRTWLKMPLAPSRNRRILVQSWGDITKGEEQGVFEPLGREDPIVVSGATKSDRSSLVIWAEDQAEREAVEALLRSQQTLLLQKPGGPNDPGEQWYLRVVDEITVARPIDKTKHRSRTLSFGWAEVRRP